MDDGMGGGGLIRNYSKLTLTIKNWDNYATHICVS